MISRRRRSLSVAVESLEARSLLSHVGPSGSPVSHPAPIVAPAIRSDPAAVSAILSALSGGAGGEWAALIRAQIRNPGSVISGFATGRIHAYTTTGLTIRTPAPQPQFTGRPYDQLLPTAASAAVFKGNVLELATILRGEFRDPQTSYYVFALDRGAGKRLGPTFASRPGITPDALVTIAVGPGGSSATGTIHDLTDGSSRAIDASRIVVQGATLRVFLDDA